MICLGFRVIRLDGMRGKKPRLPDRGGGEMRYQGMASYFEGREDRTEYTHTPIAHV